MRDYTTLHSDTDWSKGTTCSKKGCGCKWTWETIHHYTQTQIEVKEQLVVRQNMDVTKHERLSNITLRHRLKSMNMKDYTTLHSDTDWSQGTWETIQHYTQTQIEVKEQLVVRQNMDVPKHERLSNITLRHRLKSMNMRDYTTLHSDTYWSKGTDCSKTEYGCD
jgi:DNA-binding TFAR19-related protein (PDSD5 family)